MEMSSNVVARIPARLDYKGIVRLKCTSKRLHDTITNDTNFFGDVDGVRASEQTYALEHKFRFLEPTLTDLGIFSGHIKHVVRCGDRIAWRSHEESLAVWDIKKNACVFEQKTGARSSACVNGLVTGGMDSGEIKAWDMHSGELRASWKAHDNVVIRLAGTADRLVSASAVLGAVEVKTWDMDTGECRSRFKIDGPRFILGLYCIGEELLCVFLCGVVRIYSRTGTEASKQPDLFSVFCVCANSRHIFASTAMVIQVLDRGTKECVKRLDVGADATGLIQCDEWKLMGALRDGTIKVWDARSLDSIRSIKVGEGYLSAMYLENNRVVAGFGSGHIKKLDFD